MDLRNLDERIIIPDIYDLTQFNKKTHNIVINLRYNESAGHIEITQDGHTIIDTNFVRGRDKIFYNIKNSKLIMNYIVNLKMAGFYESISEISGRLYWQNINTDSNWNIHFNDTVDVYFYKPNLPPFYEACIRDNIKIYPFVCCGYYCKVPFIIFSDDIIEPVPYFDITKMKYIKKYIHNIPDTELSLVYMIYKFHNMVFIYNSHIIENDRMEVFTYWDKEYKCFNCNFDNVPDDLYFHCGDVDFKHIIGEFKHTLIYRYG